MSSPLLGTSATSSSPPDTSAPSSPPAQRASATSSPSPCVRVPDATSFYAPVAEEVTRVVSEISGLPESRGPLRRVCGDLIRRILLLSPLLDEIRDGAGDDFPDLSECLDTLHEALVCARHLLRSVEDGSKIYQVVAFG